jgi:Transposase DDE domain
MPSSADLYPLVLDWLRSVFAVAPPPSAAQSALAHLVTAVLLSQRLRPSALMRALLSPVPVPARQRYKRLARAWTRPWLAPAALTPHLVRAVLALVPPDADGRTHLALDSVRCGRWEVFTLGVLWHGRALIVGWAVLPYPWPKGQFTPTVCTLVRRVAASWPAARPAHLVADRGFPSRRLFRTLRQVRWGWTLRLQARTPVTVGGQAQDVRALLDTARPESWTARRGTYGTGPRAPSGTLVIGRGLPVVPWHQRGPASQAARARQHAERQRYLRRKHRAKRGHSDNSCETDAWVVLFSSHPTWLAAVRSYKRRWAIEGSYRDAQGGWDGRHGWDLERTLARRSDAAVVERVVGLWALGALLQTWVGAQTTGAGMPIAVQEMVGEWTTTGRVSVWARGQFALTDPSGRRTDWLEQTLRRGAAAVAAAPTPTPVLGRRRRPTLVQLPLLEVA